MIHWGSFLLGSLAAFILSAFLVGIIVWWEDRCKRRKAFEQFEHVDYDPHAGIQWTPEQLASIQRAKAYRSPSYWGGTK